MPTDNNSLLSIFYQKYTLCVSKDYSGDIILASVTLVAVKHIGLYQF